jgi:RNA polymerase sigma factor (TIGR02999 family)
VTPARIGWDDRDRHYRADQTYAQLLPQATHGLSCASRRVFANVLFHVVRYTTRGPGLPPPLRGHAAKTVMLLGDRVSHGFDVGEFGKTFDDERALDALFSATYEELRRLAASVRRGDPSSTLSPTALVNEAWLKLRESPGVSRTSRLHFKRIAARAMRQVLIEAARRRRANKRGGGATLVTFDESMGEAAAYTDDLLALDEALEDLARIQPRQATLVESRFFGGLDVAETAELLDVSESTVLRDWRAAKAWLAHELRGSPRKDS